MRAARAAFAAVARGARRQSTAAAPPPSPPAAPLPVPPAPPPSQPPSWRPRDFRLLAIGSTVVLVVGGPLTLLSIVQTHPHLRDDLRASRSWAWVLQALDALGHVPDDISASARGVVIIGDDDAAAVPPSPPSSPPPRRHVGELPRAVAAELREAQAIHDATVAAIADLAGRGTGRSGIVPQAPEARWWDVASWFGLQRGGAGAVGTLATARAPAAVRSLEAGVVPVEAVLGVPFVAVASAEEDDTLMLAAARAAVGEVEASPRPLVLYEDAVRRAERIRRLVATDAASHATAAVTTPAVSPGTAAGWALVAGPGSVPGQAPPPSSGPATAAAVTASAKPGAW